MPNWCANDLYIDGEEVQAVLDAIKSEGQVLDFNRVIPIPELLKHTVSGMLDFNGKEVTSWYTEKTRRYVALLTSSGKCSDASSGTG